MRASPQDARLPLLRNQRPRARLSQPARGDAPNVGDCLTRQGPFGRAVCYQAALFQYQHAVRMVHCHGEIVQDENDSPALIRRSAKIAQQGKLMPQVQCCERFVSKYPVGFSRQNTGEQCAGFLSPR